MAARWSNAKSVLRRERDAVPFERRQRSSGGSTRSYSQNFRTPAQKTAYDQKRMLAVLLCVFLPPVGVVYIWRSGDLGIILRLFLTLAAAATLTLYLYLILPDHTPETYRPTAVRPSQVTEYSDPAFVDAYDASRLTGGAATQ